MIRSLTRQDYDVAQAYLDNDPLNDIYLIHGLQTQRFETLWGAFDDDRLEGVLFIDSDHRHRAGYLAGDSPEVLARLGKFALEVDAGSLLGKSAYIQPAVAAIEVSHPQVEIRRTYGHLYEVHPGEAVCHYDYSVRTATEGDVALLVELYKGESSKKPEQIEREIRGAIEDSACFFVELEGLVSSAARVDPETDQAGVVESALTLPGFRGRGIYPSVRTACVEYLSEQGKVTLGVVKDTNIAMHKVIGECGGSLTDPWLYVRFRRKPPLRRRVLPLFVRRWGLSIKNRVVHR